MSIHSRLSLSAITLVLTSSLAFADDDDQLDYGWQFSVGAGITSIDQDGSINISETETDTLAHDGGSWDQWTGRIGVGYNLPIPVPVIVPVQFKFPEDEDEKKEKKKHAESHDGTHKVSREEYEARQRELEEDEEEDDDGLRWFRGITPQINLYYLGGDVSGDVYRWENPEWNEADYTMDFNSTRLMFDLAMNIVSLENWSLYVLGGLGVAWNETELDYDFDDDLGYSDFDVDTTETTAFAYEFGAGLSYALSDNWAISLEYLYADLGDIEIDGEATFGSAAAVGTASCCGENETQIESNDMDMTTQSVILGVTFAL